MFISDYKKKVILSPKYALKASINKAYLMDIGNGKTVLLSSNQHQFFWYMDGSKSLQDVAEIYDDKSKNNLAHFIEKCLSLRIIEINQDATIRLFPERTKEPHLMSVHWEITNRCNLKCKYCYQEQYFKNDAIELKKDKIFNLIDELAILNVLKISISGGEPFLRKDIFDIIEYIEKKDIRVMGIYTNGTSLDYEMLRRIKGFKSNIKLFISLDGINPRSMGLRFHSDSAFYESIPKIYSTIDNAINLKIPVTVITVIHKDNIDYLSNLYSWLKMKRIQRWRICLPVEIGRYAKNKCDFSVSYKHVLDRYYDLIKEYLSDIVKKTNTFDLEIQGVFRLNTFDKFKINAFSREDYCCDYDGKRNHICIKPNGDITPCATWLTPIGNIINDSIFDIWYSPKMQNLKNINIDSIKPCSLCPYLKYCGGGCRVQSLINNNGLYEKDDLACIQTEFIVDKIIPLIETYFPAYIKEIRY